MIEGPTAAPSPEPVALIADQHAASPPRPDAAHRGDPSGTRVPEPLSFDTAVIEKLRILVVAGISVGVVVAGIGSRLAMLVLRLTSPDVIAGVTSDDGFVIGRFTIGGTYSLMTIGAFVGVIGAVAYRAVAPWLLGPRWFRGVTVAAAAGAVVGSMLVHADGIDFTLLEPTWLAIGLFVALPAAFGGTIGWAIDRVAAPGSWTRRGRRRWILPIILVACFPVTLMPVGLVAVGLVFWAPIRRAVGPAAGLPAPVRLAVRAAWLAVAVAGLVELVNDIEALV